MRFAGFTAIMLLTMAGAYLVNSTASDPQFIEALAIYSPWAAAHSVPIGWVSSGLVMLAGMAIPLMLLSRDAQDGRDRLSEIGATSSTIGLMMFLVYGLLFGAIPAVGYLLGMGWFAAKKAAGL